jgi:hypothetical protein
MATLTQLPERFITHPRIQQLDRELISKAKVFDYLTCCHDGKSYKVCVSLDHDGTYFASTQAVGRVFWAGHHRRPSEALRELLTKLKYGLNRWHAYQHYHAELAARRAHAQ